MPYDEFHDGLGILWRRCKVSHALLDDHRDLSAQVLLAIREDPRLGVEPRIATAAAAPAALSITASLREAMRDQVLVEGVHLPTVSDGAGPVIDGRFLTQ